MRKKLIDNLNWTVWADDNGKIQQKNIFKYSGKFREGFMEAVKSYDKTKDTAMFIEEVRFALMSAYWAKCEYEVLIKPLFRGAEVKVDIYDQVMMNWDKFIDYVLRSLKTKE